VRSQLDSLVLGYSQSPALLVVIDNRRGSFPISIDERPSPVVAALIHDHDLGGQPRSRRDRVQATAERGRSFERADSHRERCEFAHG
jgi:hypothetical protein